MRSCTVKEQVGQDATRRAGMQASGRRGYHRVCHFVYFDPAEVADHIRTKFKIQPRA